jgi:hypothetical protein
MARGRLADPYGKMDLPAGINLRQRYLSASSAQSLAFEIGAVSGPFLAGIGMRAWNPDGMLIVIGAAGMILAAFVAVKGPVTCTDRKPTITCGAPTMENAPIRLHISTGDASK